MVYLNATECLSKADQGFISALYQHEVGNLSLFISGYSSVLKRDLLIRAFSQYGFSSFCVYVSGISLLTKQPSKSVVSALWQHWLCRHRMQTRHFLCWGGRFCLFCGWESQLEKQRAVSYLILCQCLKSCMKSIKLASIFFQGSCWEYGLHRLYQPKIPVWLNMSYISFCIVFVASKCPEQPAVVGPALSKEVGLDDLHRSLPTLSFLWFYICNMLTLVLIDWDFPCQFSSWSIFLWQSFKSW